MWYVCGGEWVGYGPPLYTTLHPHTHHKTHHKTHPHTQNTHTTNHTITHTTTHTRANHHKLIQVVCEEAPEDLTARLRSKTLRQTGKQRYIAGVVTPAQPNYVVGLMDDEQDDGYQHMPPVLGVTMGVSGYVSV